MYTPDDDVAPLFKLRETLDDEEMMHMMSQSQMRASLLLFHIVGPLYGQSWPKFSLCANTWGFISYFIVYGLVKAMRHHVESYMWVRGMPCFFFILKGCLSAK